MKRSVQRKMKDDPTQLVREGYDRVAADYTRRYADELVHKPLDRELLSRFAAKIGDSGDVCEVGCGPGQIARYLRDQGLVNVFGLDLSPRMVEQARQLNPDISFRVGNMLALDLQEGTLAGIVALYAIVNISERLLPQVFGEMWRVLQPGGRILLSFHIGDETVHPEEFLGHPISMDFFLFQPLSISRLLEASGFWIEDLVEREPYSPDVEYQSRRAYICALKPDPRP
jgi:SAM-dependent methyltransferase